ncbi:MAG TPA: PIN domain-containing protein [Flavobacteriales bacterium]|nr:PIN domain-containing protein [Flavobacteriales bacterium]HRO40575.1 PIN domain-containing protein [Flavobacteriales bacterium]HRP82994.1 PIN domain-containing protein [Flavobacteriales bacterium]HRQ85374.1 PIN domain-containing protein [Flavobacteriales bacterium]
MEKVFVDTNVVLDLLQERKPFFKEAQQLFSMGDRGELKLFISSLTVANTHFMLARHLQMEARQVLSKLMTVLDVLPLDAKVLKLSLASDWKDIEDAIQYFTAAEHGMHVIITRNKRDFKGSLLPILSTGEYLRR